MTNAQCDACGATFNDEDEGASDLMPDGTDFTMCGACIDDSAKTVEWFYS